MSDSATQVRVVRCREHQQIATVAVDGGHSRIAHGIVLKRYVTMYWPYITSGGFVCIPVGFRFQSNYLVYAFNGHSAIFNLAPRLLAVSPATFQKA
jgi:hypothetical protein